jgi:outer membrane protein
MRSLRMTKAKGRRQRADVRNELTRVNHFLGKTAGAAILLLAVASVPAFGQTGTAPMEQLSFDQAVQRALDKNPTVAQAATNIARAEGLLQQARAVTLPNVSASATDLVINGSRGFDGVVTQPQNTLTLAANATMPILAPSLWAATTHARDQLDLSKLSSADVRKQIAVAAAQAYLAVITQKRQLDVDMRARETSRSHLDYADQLLAAGAGTRLNELRAAQELASDDLRVENARLAVRRAQEGLGVLLASGGPVDTAGAPVFDVPAAVDEAVWMAARTDLQVSIAQQRADERIWKDSPKDILPSAALSFVPQHVTPSSLFQPANTWALTFSISQPIFQGGLNKAVTAQRKASFDLATLARTAAEIQARADERLARESLASNERAQISARVAADRAGDVLRITTAAFEAGASTNIEVIDAQRSARDADTAVTVAEDAVRRAQLDLLVALGRFPK